MQDPFCKPKNIIFLEELIQKKCEYCSYLYYGEPSNSRLCKCDFAVTFNKAKKIIEKGYIFNEPDLESTKVPLDRMYPLMDVVQMALDYGRLDLAILFVENGASIVNITRNEKNNLDDINTLKIKAKLKKPVNDWKSGFDFRKFI